MKTILKRSTQTFLRFPRHKAALSSFICAACFALFSQTATVAFASCTSPTLEPVSGGTSICTGNLAFIRMNSSQTGVTYQLYAGASAAGNTTNGTGNAITWTVSPSSTTTYAVKSTTANGYCATIMNGYADVTVGNTPILETVNGSTAICSGNQALITMNPSQSGVTYQLYAGASAAANATNGTGNAITWTVSPGSTTTYTVQSRSWNGYCATTMSGSAVVTVNPLPTVTIAPASPSIYEGSSVVLTASGGSTYGWSPATGLSATTGQSVTASPTNTTTYTTTGTDANGCTSTAQVTVTVTGYYVAGNIING
jgi:hypothetical protein